MRLSVSKMLEPVVAGWLDFLLGFVGKSSDSVSSMLSILMTLTPRFRQRAMSLSSCFNSGKVKEYL